MAMARASFLAVLLWTTIATDARMQYTSAFVHELPSPSTSEVEADDNQPLSQPRGGGNDDDNDASDGNVVDGGKANATDPLSLSLFSVPFDSGKAKLAGSAMFWAYCILSWTNPIRLAYRLSYKLVGLAGLAAVLWCCLGLEERHIVSIIHQSSPSDAAPKTLHGLNVPLHKFRAWLEYHLQGRGGEDRGASAVETRLHFFCRSDAVKAVWREECLLGNPSQSLTLGGSSFRDPLEMASESFLAILKDEVEHPEDQWLIDFIRAEYGPKKSTCMAAASWIKASHTIQMKQMQEFMDWFRSAFPYFYDDCAACGARGDASRLHVTYLGCASPDPTERAAGGRANVAEFYHCPRCGHVTKFPRFHAARAVCDGRRGRCGEYSHLLFRMLRSLGHDARYVSDVGNGHCWVEVLRRGEGTGGDGAKDAAAGQWLHLDPCEAAVDKNLLYQEWGRSLKSVFAFYVPIEGQSQHEEHGWRSDIPIIEDVTQNYTSHSRRLRMKGRRNSVDNASIKLQKKIGKLSRDTNEEVNKVLPAIEKKS